MSDTADEALADAVVVAATSRLFSFEPGEIVAAVRAAGWAPKDETLTEVEKALREKATTYPHTSLANPLHAAANLVASLHRKDPS